MSSAAAAAVCGLCRYTGVICFRLCAFVADDPTLDSRLDYMLKVRTMESAYIATLTSHTSYWTNLDIALFILTQIFSGFQPDFER